MQERIKIADLVSQAQARACPLWQIILENEAQSQDIAPSELWQTMTYHWQIMQESISKGSEPGLKSFSGLVGEEARLLNQYLARGRTLSGEGAVLAAARALGVSIVNASMGKIVAAPTAGSCGVLPAVLLTTAERIGADQDSIIGALFTAAGIGLVIDENATTSGAKGGCQAECGAAACMAAAAAVEMAGGTPNQAAQAGAIALKNVIGLACDPVAGLVEIPCVKRNAMGASNALLAADMALAGIASKIPLDEVIEAMREVGEMLPSKLKETAQGGLATTPTGQEIARQLLRT